MRHITFIAIILLLSFGCRKDENTAIPLVSVNLNLNLNNPEFVHLKTDNGWVYVSGGSRGIVVYRTNGTYKAFDRHCPYNPTNSCGLVSVDVTNITGLDDCCGSKFLMSSGQVTQGPAVNPLKEYSTSLNGDVLHIGN